MTTHIAVVVREYGDSDAHAAGSDEEARAWLVGALYLVEEGLALPGDPPPPLAELEAHARDFGWEASITVQSGPA